MVLVWALLGCTDLFGPEELITRKPALDGDDVVWTAPFTTAPAPIPGWVSGELPDSPTSMSEPERRALEGRICDGGDPALNDRIEARLTKEAATVTYPGPWTNALLERCSHPGPALCDWISERVTSLPEGEAPGAGLFELWHVAGGCLDPDIWEWMPRPHGALYGTVDYLAQQDSQWRPIRDERIPNMIGPILSDGSGLHYDYALQVLGSVDDPRAARILLDHRAPIRDVIEADRVGVWLYRQTDPDARRAFELACVSQPAAWQCREALNPLDDLDATVLAENTDASSVIERYPSHRTAILESFERCVKLGPTEARARAGRCMRALAGAGEDARVVDALTSVEEQVIDPLWNSRIRAWKRFGSAEAIGAHLAGLDLLPEGFEPLDPAEPPAYVVDWFVDSERGLLVSGLTNDIALRRLLVQVPELRDVVVVTRRTPASAPSGAEPFDELLAWVEGRRHRVIAEPYGVDVRQVAGFANALAEARDIDVRFVAIDPGDLIVWGPQKGLRALVGDELLDVLPKSVTLEEDFEEDIFEP